MDNVKFNKATLQSRDESNKHYTDSDSEKFLATQLAYETIYINKDHENYNLKQKVYLENLGYRVNIQALRYFKKCYQEEKLIDFTNLAKSGVMDYSSYCYGLGRKFNVINWTKLDGLLEIATFTNTKFMERLPEFLTESKIESTPDDQIKRQATIFNGMYNNVADELTRDGLKTVNVFLENWLTIGTNALVRLDETAQKEEQKKQKEIIQKYESEKKKKETVK